MKYFYFLSIILLFSSCFKGEQVDLIIHNAKVHTMNKNNDIFEAIAINDGQIVLAGSEREILNRFRGKKEINAQQKDVFPGFHDGHGHIMSLARQKLEVDLTGTQSYYEMLIRLEKFQEKNNVDFIVGRGWDQSLWGDSILPNFDLLNERFPSIPVALTRVDGHAMLINQKAIEVAGIDNKTKIDGGKIILNDEKPTGLILDNAIDLVKKHIPKPTKEQLKEVILSIQNELISLGITHVHEAGVSFSDLMILDELASDNLLKINVYAMLFTTPENKTFAKENGIYKNGKLSVRSFKILMDGALGSYGACLLHPYTSNPSESGFLLTSIMDMKSNTQFAKDIGYQVNTHCIGDSANRIMLNRINELMKDVPDHRWRIEHAQVINTNDFNLFSESGAIPSVQPTHATSDQRWAEKHIGKKRLKGAYAYKSLLEERKIMIFGTDFPVEDFNPFGTIHAAVKRKNTEDEPIDGFLIDEAVTLENSLKAMTLWAAYGCFEENKLGSLEKGKKATLVIFDQPVVVKNKFLQNYAAVSIIDGDIVYDIDL